MTTYMIFDEYHNAAWAGDTLTEGVNAIFEIAATPDGDEYALIEFDGHGKAQHLIARAAGNMVVWGAT